MKLSAFCIFPLLAHISLQFDALPQPGDALGIQVRFQERADLSNDALWKILGEDWQPVRGNMREISYSPYTTWLKIPLENLRQRGHYSWLEIPNPHINHLRIWITARDSLWYEGALTGDNHPYRTRPLPSRGFLFPLNNLPDTEGYLVIAADKRLSKLNLPLHFQTDSHLVKHFDLDQKYIMFFWGFAAFLFLFNAYLFLSTRDAVFGWFLLYLLLIVSYVGMEIGLYFKVLYPDFPQWNDVLRPASFALSIVPMLMFYNRILDIAHYAPALNRWNKIITGVYFFLFIIAVSTSAITSNPEVQGFWLLANRIVTPITMGIIFAEALYFFFRGHYLAIFPLGSISALLFFTLLYIAHQQYYVAPSIFSTYALFWGLSADAIFMALSLAWRFWYYRKNMELLIQEKAERQLQLTLEISNWKEQQMQQIFTFLHDRIGGLMGILRLSVDTMALNEQGRKQLATEIVSVADEIRHYSHTNSPMMIHTLGLRETIEGLIQKIQSRSDIHFQLEWEGSDKVEPDQLRVFLYFCVQEMFHNMLKHSNCSRVVIQVMNQPDRIYLYFEDNGRGANQFENSLGAGLKSIKRIVDLLGGRFLIQATPNVGFSLSIELQKSS